MTIFVVSLFLPYTVNFHDPEDATPRPPSPDVQRGSRPGMNGTLGRGPSLFQVTNAATPIPTLTPGATTDTERIFLQQKDKLISQGGKILAPSDPLSPAWGKATTFNQPKSQATEAPPTSILKHNKKPTDFARGRAASHLRRMAAKSIAFDKIRPSSHERFSDAAWTVEPAEQGNGGLRNAVQAATDSGFIEEKTWVGTLGMPTDTLDNHTKMNIAEKLEDDYDSLTVYVSDSDFDGHYSHYCKTILWPVFHYQIPDNPKSKAYEDHSWEFYVKLNQAFADRIAKNWKRGDVVWIHDYHLLLVPKMLRKQIPDAQIGFFLHVAFPSSEVFRCIACREELLEGVLGANLIGFQTDEYCHHFLQTCSRIIRVEATTEGIQLEDRFVNVGKFPIGIDPASLNKRREGADVAASIHEIREKYKGKHLIVARDKLDHVRGVRQKILAYELFLNRHPEWRHKVVLIQVATSTTEQAELDATVSDIVTRVNSQHSTLAHQPLVFLKQDISFAQYLALMTVADVLMITSLREGMNLTCHEYLFCQDGKYSDKKHGTLILSEFTGSASFFNGTELLINPWDYRKCSDAIYQALEMSEEEKDKRWQPLYDLVVHNTADRWFRSTMKTLKTVYNEHHLRDTMSVPRLSYNTLCQKYRAAAGTRLFIVDYEGTLASWGSPKSIIMTTPQRAIDVLNDLVEHNVVYVMSGRMPEELERLFRRVPGLGLIAENGCFIREAGADDWVQLANGDVTDSWKDSLETILEYYRDRIEGSKIESRHCSLRFDYSESEDKESAQRLAAECANHVNDACSGLRVHTVSVDGAIIFEPMDITKATAANTILERMKKKNNAPQWLFVAGDGREDEAVFRWANRLGESKEVKDVMTVTLGTTNTEAMATMTQGVTGVLSTLQKLAAST